MCIRDRFGSIAAENVLVYTPGSQEEHYREYDKARQRLLDYGVPEWDDYQAEYGALGLTRTDVINLEKWLIADYDRYTADTFNAIVAFRQDRPFQWEYLLDYLRILIMKPLFLLGAFGWLLWFAASFRKKKDLPAYVVVFWPGIALLGVYLYFIRIYRVLPIVVTACLLMFVIFKMCIRDRENDMKQKGNPLAQFLIGLAMLVSGGYWFLSSVAVHTAFYSLRLGGMRLNGGVVVVPFIVGVIWICVNTDSFGAKLLTGAGLLMIVASVIAGTEFVFRYTCLLYTSPETVFMQTLHGLTMRLL